MTRDEALAIILEFLPEEAVVIAANGHTSRALHRLADRPRFFYMIGSMGLAPAIALGICAAQAQRQVLVLDGDGNLLMNLNGLAAVAARSPIGLVHICLDNGCHASTGGQKTISSSVDLARIAGAAGYHRNQRVASTAALRAALGELFVAPGPSFLLAEIEAGGLAPETPRVAPSPEALTDRLRRELKP